MNKTLISIAGPLAISLGLSGCVATNQSSTNPMQQVSLAESEATPEFAEDKLATRHSSLLERYRKFQQAPSDFLETDAPSTCDLSRAGEWLVTHGKPESEINALQSVNNGHKAPETTVTTIESVSLIDGECRDGVPEGPFVGVGQYRQVVTSENNDIDPWSFTNRVRLEGVTADGRLDGDFALFSSSEKVFQLNGDNHTSTTLTATAGQSENGRDTGTHLEINGLKSGALMYIASQEQPKGFVTTVRKNRQTAMGLQTESQTYLGSRLFSTTHKLNHATHGWSTNHLMPEGQKRTCWYQGKTAQDDRCTGLSLPTIASESVPDDVLEQLVRQDNQGEYMSPYTSDGVLAEWVNMGTSANVGGTVGSGVGAAAGSMIADKALESVPFGSLIGGIIGSQVGEEMGREAGISASGGWENIRATSDRSFDSLTDMARYLAQKYGHEPTYGDAIQVTLQVYPELQNAMASAY